MRVIVSGPRDFKDYNLVCKAIEKSGLNITEVVSGNANGVDSLGEQWARENGIPVKLFPAEWKDLTLPGAVPKKNQYGVYNSTAGLYRNGLMAEYADALIAIRTGSDGTGNMISQMKKSGKEVYSYQPGDLLDESEVGYTF